jgi:hypothetical protein
LATIQASKMVLVSVALRLSPVLLLLPEPLPEAIVEALALDEPIRGACSVHAAERQRINCSSCISDNQIALQFVLLSNTDALANNRFACVKLVFVQRSSAE